MSLWRTVTHSTATYRLLRVPHVFQAENPGTAGSDNYCLPMSLKMVLDFMVDPYQPPAIRQNNKAWRVDDITDHLPFHPFTGCKIYPTFLDALNAELKFFQFTLRRANSLSEVEAWLSHDRPSIALYNPLALLTSQNVGGMGHASVVIGCGTDYVWLNDPFQLSPLAVQRDRFEAAWLLEPFNTITVENKTEQAKLPGQSQLTGTTDPPPQLSPAQDVKP